MDETQAPLTRMPAPQPWPWQASTALLCLACVPVAWVCRATGARGWPDELAPWVLMLIALVGSLPFYMRRNHAFTLGGIAVAVGVGLVLAALGWLLGVNSIVFVWLGMAWAVQAVAHATAHGRRIQQQIALEKANSTAWLNTKTEQAERMLFAYEFATVLLAGLVLWVLREVWRAWVWQ